MIKCILLSEFHHTQGPKITHQVPAMHITNKMFDSLHHFFITKPEFQNRLITVNQFQLKFVGVPVNIESQKYHRNAFIFNISFVFEEDLDCTSFNSVIRKLAEYLTQLEREQCFLSQPEHAKKVAEFLSEVYTNLNNQGYCRIFMAKSCVVHLKLGTIPKRPISVQDHDVPVFTKPRDIILKHQWDLTTQQILHYIDGVSHILNIAAEADVELNLVKASVQNLVFYNLLTLIPIFQYGNAYVATKDINMLMEDVPLQNECIEFVAKSERCLPNLYDVMRLLTSFVNGVTVKDLCASWRPYNPHALKVDERKLVTFGVLKGLIRRVHKYPFILPGNTTIPKLQPLAKYFDGSHHYDQICCETGLAQWELDEMIEEDMHVFHCHR